MSLECAHLGLVAVAGTCSTYQANIGKSLLCIRAWHVCGARVDMRACAVRPNALWLVVVQCQKVEGTGTNMEV
jgi:hypothetical protein